MSDQQSNRQPGQQGVDHQIRNVAPADGNDVRQMRPTIADFAFLAAEAGFAIWIITDLIGNISRPRSQRMLLLVGVALILFSFAHKITDKVWPKKRPVWLVWFLVCAALALAVVKNPRPLPEKLPVPLAVQPEDPYSGVLEPAHDPLPFPNIPNAHSVSDFPSNSIFLFAGPFVFVGVQSKSLCLISYKDECLISIDQQENSNAALISARFFDEDGRLVAELSSNRFDAALPPTTFRVYRPNRSTLIVRDSRGTEVLNIKYLNRFAFEMTGVVRFSDKQKVTITSVPGQSARIEVQPRNGNFVGPLGAFAVEVKNFKGKFTLMAF